MGGSKFRLAVGQISSESNHFVTSPCELDMFRNTGYLLEGEDLFQLKGAGTEVSEALGVFADSGEVEVLPLLAARANSSGPLSQGCYGHLRGNLLQRFPDVGATKRRIGAPLVARASAVENGTG